MVVPVEEGTPAPTEAHLARLASLPFVVVGVVRGRVHPRWTELCDVTVAHEDPTLARIEENLATRPITCTTLALLLRGQAHRSVDDGLVAESAAYSVLQSGPEFAAWRAAHPVRTRAEGGARVRTERRGSTLTVTLDRPERLNALDARMRDELVEVLALAATDREVARLELRGAGRAFCAGGDLDEFGSRADPASAHLVRLQRSAGRALARLAKPTVAFVHGPTMGSGIELASFCDTVVAAEDTVLALPEVELGLVPGAGGTVSLTRRIGRPRTALLALSGQPVDAKTALAWGLVDHLQPASAPTPA